MTFHVIIPAGGAGTRLWPLSRQRAPKFLSDLTGVGRTLIQQTVDRVAPIADSVTVVTGAAHEESVREQIPGVGVVVEPQARGTMGAIGLAAALIERDDPDAIVGSFAADHLIKNEDAFRAAVTRAIREAEAGYFVTIGITPDYPSTAYGYIEAGQARGGACTVSRFVEKPDAETAAEYLATGHFLWNAGMFVVRAKVLLDTLMHFHPEVAQPLRELAERWNGDRDVAISELWDSMPSTVIDTAIAEPLADIGGVAVVPVDMGWSDVGDYASLAEVIDADARAKQVAPGGAEQPTMLVDSPDSLVYSGHKPVVVAGIPGAVVVDMEDVLLVTTTEHAQLVKEVTQKLGPNSLGHLV